MKRQVLTCRFFIQAAYFGIAIIARGMVPLCKSPADFERNLPGFVFPCCRCFFVDECCLLRV